MAVDNQAAASLPPVDKEKVSPPLPVAPVPAPVDDKIVNKQMAVLVQVDSKPASSLSISPPQAVMVSDNNNNNNNNTARRTTTTARAADPFLLLVCLWALINATVFAVVDVATLIINRTPCTKSMSLFRCVMLTHAAAVEAGLLLYGELLCSTVVVLAAPLHMLLTMRTTTTTSSRWGAVVVDSLAWVALAATAGMHMMEIASDRIFLAADSGDDYIFVDVVCGSAFLAVDLLAGVLLCCCSVRLGEQRGHDDGEV